MLLTFTADAHSILGRAVGHLEALGERRRFNPVGQWAKPEPPLALEAVVDVVEVRDLAHDVRTVRVLAIQPPRQNRRLTSGTRHCKTREELTNVD